ncbi:hypothetical protein K474DRAFT_1661982 [Panus rudis PR-1116 ss-1]|nr:hypothetical protein K474DRAFT_1661982 [Panus rudis PR-1116 ss-1]
METTLDFLRAYTPARVSQVLAASPIGKGIGRTFNSTNHRARNTHESDVESDEDDDENALCAYGDVSLADAYEIPGTPSTRKPRLKPRREKPLPPSSSGRARRHRDTDVKPTSSGSGSVSPRLVSSRLVSSRLVSDQLVVDVRQTLRFVS